MPQQINIKDFFERISLAQEISNNDPNIQDYAGCDTELSIKLAQINVLIDHELLEETEDILLIKDILKEKIKAVMASSDKMDNFSKLGFRTPRSLGGVSLRDTSEDIQNDL